MDNKKKIILSVLVVLLILAIGVTYAFFSYENGTKSDIVTGQIYMNYEETSTISLTGVFPETKAQALARQDENGVFEFTITGRNTSNKPVYYEIDLLDGGVITGKTASSTKILPEHVRIYLERDGEPLIDGMTYQDFNNRRVWVETVPANQDTNIEHKYTLRMWIDESVTISDTNRYADYTTSEWNSAYASLKVRVTGDFNVKTSPYDYMARFGTIDFENQTISFWPDVIEAEKSNITSVNFVQMDQTTMQERYSNSTIKADVTDTTKSDAGSVLAWLETEATDNTKYTMYVASDGTTYFPTDLSGMFVMVEVLINGATDNLSSINFENINTKYVENMSFMFGLRSKLTSLDLSGFDTSNVTNIFEMFMGCSSLRSLDLSGFDTSNVTDMGGMFSSCSNLTSLDVSNFDTRNVTNMNSMFAGCSGLTSLDLSKWDTSNVIDMSSIFNGCSNLTNLDLNGWNLSKITSIQGLFLNLSNLENVNLSGWDISNVTNMNDVFNGCSNLTNLDLNYWNTSKVIHMNSMFYGCSNLISLDLSSFATNSVTDMTAMFKNCSSLKELDLSNFNTSKVSTIEWIFEGCSNLTTIYADTDWNNGNIYDDEMFSGCTSLVGAVPFDATKTDITMANPDTGYFTYKNA